MQPLPHHFPRRSSAALRAAAALAAASLALTACGPLDEVSSGGDWRSAARCQPQENPAPGGSPGDGPMLSPREILPDPATCPEAYRSSGRPIVAPPPSGGSGSGSGGAPVRRVPSPNLDHGCAEGATLNGSPCTSVPGTGRVIYPGAPGLDHDPPQIPDP